MLSPILAAVTGALAGLAGSLGFSLLARLVPTGRGHSSPERNRRPGPSAALVQAEAPGPEGLAAQFGFKIAAGLFGKDVSSWAGTLGFLVHIAYGSFWGFLYGIVQASFTLPWAPFGALYGTAVWLIGPCLLVPAMRIMRYPTEEPRPRTAMMMAGHIVYGLSVALTFRYLQALA